MCDLLARQDHAAAIAALKEQVITEENSEGLIPVKLKKFVTDGVVNTAKLWLILTNVHNAWQMRLDELEREKEERRVRDKYQEVIRQTQRGEHAA